MSAFSPHAACYAIGCALHDLRNWRRDGYLRELGSRSGKAIHYTFEEVALIAVGAFFAKYGIRLRDAFAEVHERSAMIARTIQPEAAPYFLYLALDPELVGRYSSVTAAPGLHRIRFLENPEGVLQVNISAIVHRVRERLDTWERAKGGQP